MIDADALDEFVRRNAQIAREHARDGASPRAGNLGEAFDRKGFRRMLHDIGLHAGERRVRRRQRQQERAELRLPALPLRRDHQPFGT
jgi:hypothetical protein